ncbi:hypothetical protein X777_06882 [Ooceraea biroi]|uniref:Uncharacterized protein n=1 Tax=Ooceraea biroi TaxID=2015173 RepID=A0A026WCH1_OOCBI|nr:hypothetical protein X777_06882 [Ooceraea biroi]
MITTIIRTFCHRSASQPRATESLILITWCHRRRRDRDPLRHLSTLLRRTGVKRSSRSLTYPARSSTTDDPDGSMRRRGPLSMHDRRLVTSHRRAGRESAADSRY